MRKDEESRSQGRHAFTLTELMVVVGIIAVLVGILVPVISGARNRARMVKCASNLREIGVGLLQYAADNGGNYPIRTGMNKASLIYNGNPASDQRVLLKGYVDFNTLGCPFAPAVLDYQNHTGSTSIEWTYQLFHSFQYNTLYNGQPEKGAFKVGRPFTYQGKSYSVLASDEQWDWSGPIAASSFSSEGQHPTTGVGTSRYPNSTFPGLFAIRWDNAATGTRTPVDLNFLFNDGSVTTLQKVPLNYWSTSSPSYRPDVDGIPVFITSDPWKNAVPAGR